MYTSRMQWKRSHPPAAYFRPVGAACCTQVETEIQPHLGILSPPSHAIRSRRNRSLPRRVADSLTSPPVVAGSTGGSPDLKGNSRCLSNQDSEMNFCFSHRRARNDQIVPQKSKVQKHRDIVMAPSVSCDAHLHHLSSQDTEIGLLLQRRARNDQLYSKPPKKSEICHMAPSVSCVPLTFCKYAHPRTSLSAH